jgi:hypothetical protein
MDLVTLKRFDTPDETRVLVKHDSWVIGNEPYVSLHFLGAEQYATK